VVDESVIGGDNRPFIIYDGIEKPLAASE
jgi:hypothetical protein